MEEYIELTAVSQSTEEETQRQDTEKEAMNQESFNRKEYEKNLVNHGVAAFIVRSLIVGILVVALIGNSVSLLFYYRYSVKQLYNRVHSIASECAAYVDGDLVLDYLKTGEKDAEYLWMEEFLQAVDDEENCVSIYVGVMDAQEKTRTYICDVVSASSGFTPYEIGYQDSYAHHSTQNQAYLEAAAAGAYDTESDEPDTTHLLNKSKELGYYIEVIKPVYDSAGQPVAFVCVIKQENEMFQSLRIYGLEMLISGVLLAALAATFMVILMRRKMLRPLKAIVDETERFRTEGIAAKTSAVQQKRPDEFSYLAASLQRMETDIERKTESIRKNTEEKARMDGELNLARQIQQACIPKTAEELKEQSAVRIGAMMEPARQVGGDFYDFYLLDKKHLVITIADVSDKGIAAAMFMMMTKFMLKERVIYGGTPSEILKDVNESICRYEEDTNFVTLWLGILDLTSGVITACNAGHEYPLLKMGDRYEYLKDVHGLAVGVIPEVQYHDYQITLKKGDRIFLYTDGLAEAVNAGGEAFGTARMLENLNACGAKFLSPQGEVDYMWEKLNSFTKDVVQFDDTTMLCLEYLAQTEEG